MKKFLQHYLLSMNFQQYVKGQSSYGEGALNLNCTADLKLFKLIILLFPSGKGNKVLN